MNYRERKQRRMERRLEWAAKRQAKANACFKVAEPFRGDIAFNTQPGHIPLRARVIRATERGYENMNMANHHESVAQGIEHQLETSIYSDDHDAIEKLRERIATLEAERERVKAYNKTCKKGTPDLSILDERQKVDLFQSIKVWGEIQCKGGVFPAYHLQNLGGNINRNKKRLAWLEAKAQEKGVANE